MADLGDYYAEKILAAADLSLFDGNGKPERQAAAIQHLESALGYWKAYAEVAASQYKPQHLGRIDRVVDVKALTDSAASRYQTGARMASGRNYGRRRGPGPRRYEFSKVADSGGALGM